MIWRPKGKKEFRPVDSLVEDQIVWNAIARIAKITREGKFAKKDRWILLWHSLEF